MDIISTTIYFLKLTLETEVLWIVAPLAIAVVLMGGYAWVYREEAKEWSSHLASSLVLVFVSIALLNYIYRIGGFGAANFITYWEKTGVTFFLLAVGLVLVRLNFEHILPKKIADYISSPLTINLLAFAIILFVHSSRSLSLESIISLLLIVALLSGLVFLMKYPMRFLSREIEREKKREREKDIREAVCQIQELKDELKRREKEMKTIKLKQLETSKKEAVKFKKISRKVLRVF